MDQGELEQAILEHVGQLGYEPAKPRVIARRLGMGGDDEAQVRRAIKRLVHQGRLRYGPKHMVQPADPTRPRPGRVVGVFRRMEAGYGFVRPSTVRPGETVEEIFIPARRTRDAATGDVVAVELSRKRAGQPPGPRGKIVEVIERQTHQFVGTYSESAGAAYVEVDGTLFAHPIYVGDPGTHRVRPGDKVVIEMLRFPSPFREGEAVITEVLGPLSRPGVDTLSILREFSLPEAFPEEVVEEARAEAERFDEEQFADRVDATKETIITIDPPDAKDFDDAISLVPLEEGRWRLGVHIADVAHFVRPKTGLDREARQRATSVYLPDRVIPMLPELISNGLASLQPGKRRLAKSVYIELTADGLPVTTDIRRSVIKSRKRLTYQQVDQVLADPDPWRRKLGVRVVELLMRMRELARVLRQRRFRHGALELCMPEVDVDLDRHGRVVGASVAPYTESHQIIEEFMLAANEAIARWLAEKEIPFLRRVHPSPTPRKLKALTEFVTELGLAVGSLENRFELQKLLRHVTGRPEQHAVHYAVLRSLPRAVYSPEPAGHYALASDCYCHFTSPIRRYPDLTVHRLVDAVLDGTRPAIDADQLVVLGEHCSEQEQRAEAAERELTRLKLLAYLSDRIGQVMEAVVTGVESYGLFVQGLELPAEGLIHISSLADDFYRFDRAGHTLAGHRSGNTFRLGDVLQVAVHRVDLERRQLDFRLVKKRRPSGRALAPAGQRGYVETKRKGSPKKTTKKKRRKK